LGSSGANLVTGGYFDSKSKDATPGSTFLNIMGLEVLSLPGSLKDNTQVPFIGAYTAYTQGSFFADGQLRFDYYQSSITDPLSVAFLAEQ
jgi:hypothetical protein